MTILLLSVLVALSMADVSHLQEYKYENPVPKSNNGFPKGSVDGSIDRLTLPSTLGSLNFKAEGHALSNAPVTNFDQDSTGNNGPLFNFGASSGTGTSGFGVGTTNKIIHGQAGHAGAYLGQPFVSNSGASFNIGASGSRQSPEFGLGGSTTYQGKLSGDSVDDASAAAAEASSSADASKHLYFFSAPEEEDEVLEAKYDLPAVPTKKSYKIIFIKAPIYKNQATITLPAPPQIEEKTLVYVLVRKHDDQPKVHFKEAAPTLFSKPEVFFIRYKTQKEAEAAIANIQSTHGASGQVIANLPVGTQAAFESSPDGSIVHNSSSLDIGSISGFDSVSGASASSGGFSLDSLGANSFVGANVASEQVKPQLSEEDSAQNRGDNNVQTIANQGLISQSPTPVTFGQNSINSLHVFGGGIAPSQSAHAASIRAEASADVSGQQQESSETTASIAEEYTTTENASAANYSENVEQSVCGSDNNGQGANTAGL